MFAGHLRHDLMEEEFVFIVDQTIVEDALRLVAEEPPYLFVISDTTRISLEYT
jgi:hypothetical protein